METCLNKSKSNHTEILLKKNLSWKHSAFLLSHLLELFDKIASIPKREAHWLRAVALPWLCVHHVSLPRLRHMAFQHETGMLLTNTLEVEQGLWSSSLLQTGRKENTEW